MNQFEKIKLVQKKFEPEVNLNHNIYITGMAFFVDRNTSPLLIFNTAKRKRLHTFSGILLSKVHVDIIIDFKLL